MSKYTLILEDIGKFKNTNFELDEVTVFYGSNEAGKTTVIDGVINAMAKSKKNEPLYNHILRPRYGENISTKLKLNANNEEIEKVDHDLAKDLLLVRSSDLELSMEGSWIAAVKDKLFLGGVNPQSLIEHVQLMEDKQTKKSKSPLFDVKNIDDEINQQQESLDKAKEAINSHAKTIKKQEDLKESEDTLDEELKATTEQYENKSKDLKKYKNIQEREHIKSIQKDISDKQKHEEAIKKAKMFSESVYETIKKIESDLANIANQLEMCKASQQLNKNSLEKMEQEIQDEKDKLETVKSHHELALLAQNRLDHQISDKSVKANSSPIAMLVAGGICILVGVVLLAVPGEFAKIAKISGVIAALIGTGIFIRAIIGQKKGGDSNLDFKPVISTFNQQYGEKPSCPNSDYKSAKDFLGKLIDAYKNAKNDLEGLLKKEKELKQAVKDLKNQQEHRREELQEKETELRRMLPTGILDGENYYKSLQEKKALVDKLDELNKNLQSASDQFEFSDIEVLIQHIEIKIIEINKNPVEESPLSQREMTLLEKQVSELQLKKEKLNQDLGGVGRDLTETNTVIKLEVGRLSNEQVAFEKEIHALTERKDEKLLAMDSLRLLKSVVEEIDEDAGQKFQALNDSINEYMRIILGEEREISFENLTDVNGIKCQDHYGKDVEIAQLSSGTRDALVFSARLAFLEKVNPQGDIFLILDDPFLYMDHERIKNALDAIKHFYNKLKLPLVFFTKDEHTKSGFCDVFSEAKVICLGK